MKRRKSRERGTHVTSLGEGDRRDAAHTLLVDVVVELPEGAHVEEATRRVVGARAEGLQRKEERARWCKKDISVRGQLTSK